MFDDIETLAVIQSKQDEIWENILRSNCSSRRDNRQQHVHLQPQPFSADELHTIQEEDDELQFCMLVEKLSQSGLMFNKRVLAIDQDCLSYYAISKDTITTASSSTSSSNKMPHAFKHRPKVRIAIQDIQHISIVNERKQHLLKISGNGQLVRKGKRPARSSAFQYTFKFQSEQHPALWRKLILAAQQAVRSKQYLLTFDNLLEIPSSREIQ